MNEAILIFSTGIIGGIGLTVAAMSLVNRKQKAPPNFLEKLHQATSAVSLPPWSNGYTISWLYSQIGQRLNGIHGNYDNLSDEDFIVRLFLDLGRDKEEKNNG